MNAVALYRVFSGAFGDLEGYIRSSRMVLVFCTSGYFSSKNCMRELRMAVKLRKAIIPLVETDPLKGGVTILGVYTAHTRIFWAYFLVRSCRALDEPRITTPTC